VNVWEIEGRKGLITRLLKYEGVNGAGNAVTVLVQLLLLNLLSFSPVLGNIIGAIIAYPVTYFISMRLVWRAQTTQGLRRDVDEPGTSKRSLNSSLAEQVRPRPPPVLGNAGGGPGQRKDPARPRTEGPQRDAPLDNGGGHP
jgi:GtrA-like protein